MGNKMKKTKHQHKNVNHNPQVESVKACFAEPMKTSICCGCGPKKIFKKQK